MWPIKSHNKNICDVTQQGCRPDDIIKVIKQLHSFTTRSSFLSVSHQHETFLTHIHVGLTLNMFHYLKLTAPQNIDVVAMVTPTSHASQSATATPSRIKQWVKNNKLPVWCFAAPAQVTCNDRHMHIHLSITVQYEGPGSEVMVRVEVRGAQSVSIDEFSFLSGDNRV